MSIDQKISFIGGGNMAQAIIGGLLAQGVLPNQITVSEPMVEIQQQLQQLELNVIDDNEAAIQQADVVIIAVKPQVLNKVLLALAGKLQQQLLISIVAGVPIFLMQEILQGYDNIVRVMPNTPALIQQGISGAYTTTAVSADDRAIADKILSSIGEVVWVAQEQQLDAITAVSGSGPAYFFYVMEAMIQAGKNLGLDEQMAAKLTLQTALGAAKMATCSTHSPAQLRKNVTSPNGTTQAALEVFDHCQVSQSIQMALAAAEKRSKALAQEFASCYKVG